MKPCLAGKPALFQKKYINRSFLITSAFNLNSFCLTTSVVNFDFYQIYPRYNLKKEHKPETTLTRRKHWLFCVVKMACIMLLQPLFRIKAEGIENLPQDKAYVLLPKHQRWEDIPLIGLAAKKPLYYIAKHELFTIPLSKWFFVSLGGIPLNRKKPLESRKSLLAVIGLLKEGEGVVLFPEGTYYKDAMGPGHKGIVRLILSRLSIPFIPVGIKYSKQRLRTLTKVRFGDALYPAQAGSADLFLDILMKKIADLSGLG